MKIGCLILNLFSEFIALNLRRHAGVYSHNLQHSNALEITGIIIEIKMKSYAFCATVAVGKEA